MALVDLISVTSIIDISQVPFAGDIKIKECLIMIRKKNQFNFRSFPKILKSNEVYKKLKEDTLFFREVLCTVYTPFHSFFCIVVFVFRHIPKNDISLKVQQTHFLVWDTPDHTNIHMFINLNSINEDNLYGLCILEISYQPIEYGFLYLYSSSQCQQF